MKTNVSRVENEPSVLFGSKIVISEGLRPKRIVLREEPAKFIVHLEYLDAEMKAVEPPGERSRYELVFTHECFDLGTYFDFNEINGVTRAQAKERAEKCFMERALEL